MKRRLIFLVSGLFLTGCSSSIPPMPLSERFDDSAFAVFAATGTASISGHATLQRNGREISCIKAFLLPATPYIDNSVEIWRQGAANEEWMDQQGPNVGKAIRNAECNAAKHGEFAFANLPEGNWYVMTWIILSPLSSESSGHYDKYTWGGKLVQNVRTTAGSATVAELTEKDVVNRKLMW